MNEFIDEIIFLKQEKVSNSRKSTPIGCLNPTALQKSPPPPAQLNYALLIPDSQQFPCELYPRVKTVCQEEKTHSSDDTVCLTYQRTLEEDDY